MSVQFALDFIKKLKIDQDLQEQFLALGSNQNLDDCVKLGRELGWDFSRQELEIAHKHDWGMRWVIYKS